DTTDIKDFFGFVECFVKTTDYKAIPIHSVISDSRLIFPIFKNWTKITIFSKEVNHDIYDYRFTKGVKFKAGKFKKKFFNDGFLKKAYAKKNGDAALAQAYKIIINSGYGFWGLKTKNRDGVMIYESNDSGYHKYLSTNKLVNIREYKNYYFCRILKDLDVKDFNVGVAAAISSYARLKLHSMITAIKKVGGKIYYCDTDSVICNINLNEYPNIKNRFQWDGNGEELGSLKNECDDYVKKLLKKLYPTDKKRQSEVFNNLLKEEKGNLSWDDGLITGCKQYALKKNIIIDGKNYLIESVKLKGYSQRKKKLTFEDMSTLNEGKKVFSQIQDQFRCPKSNYVSDTSSFEIKTKQVKKRFRKTYTKGKIFQGFVFPHII
ncbi:MAG: DNA polymerase, partial [Planctomycetota bacterium]